MKTGKVYWITGLSGAGKTTIAKKLYNELFKNEPCLLLDGDTLRSIFGVQGGHDYDKRLELAMCYARLCKAIASQGLGIICSTISMFDSVREWNRKNIDGYFEIYLRVPMTELEKRDGKEIYSRAKSGELKNVVGIDLEWEEPKSPDIIIENYGDISSEAALKKILDFIEEKK